MSYPPYVKWYLLKRKRAREIANGGDFSNNILTQQGDTILVENGNPILMET